MRSLLVSLFALLLGADVYIRQQVEENLNPGEEKEFLGGRVVIRKVYNRGFLLNLLDRYPAVVRGASIVAGAGVLVWDILAFAKKGHYVKKLGMTLVSAGAAGNLFDRLARGKVIDYIGIRSGRRFLDRVTANLGDIYIACGSLLVMGSECFHM